MTTLSSFSSSNQNQQHQNQCRWGWCSKSFDTLSALRTHVEEDHIEMAQPVRRGDVPILRKAEGESVGLSWLEWSASASGSGLNVDGTQRSPTSQRNLGLRRREIERVEKGVMTDDNIDDDINANDNDNNITMESSSFMPPPSTPSKRHLVVPLGAYSPRRSEYSPAQSQSQSQPQSPFLPESPSQHPFLQQTVSPLHSPQHSFEAIRGTLNTPPLMPPPSPGTGPLVFASGSGSQSLLASGFGAQSLLRGGSASPLNGDLGDTSVESHLTSPLVSSQQAHAQTQVQDVSYLQSQWQPQSQLPMASFPVSTIDPSQLHVRPHSTPRPGGSPSRSPRFVTNAQSQGWSQELSQNQDHSQLPYARGFGYGYGEAQNQTQLQTQAMRNMDDSLSSSQSQSQ